MKLTKKPFVRRLFLFSFITLFVFIIAGFSSLKTFAKSNIDFTEENDISDYKYSNLIISELDMQFQEQNYIEFEFFDINNVSQFYVQMYLPVQGAFYIVIDDEFNFSLSNIRFSFNFIEFLISKMSNVSTNYDYISIFENGYFRVVDWGYEIYDFIVSSDFFTFDFIIYEPSIIDYLSNVFINIGGNLILLINGLIVLFYINGQLTFMGILAIVGLGISLIFLFIAFISKFLKFRG